MAGPVTAAGGRPAPAASVRAPQGSAASPVLPPLRDELTIEPGPRLRGGAPSWTLYDPAAHRYYRLGWLEFEILARWHLRRPDDIAARIQAETTLAATADDVKRVLEFLSNAELVSIPTHETTKRMLTRRAARRQGLLTRLLHNYLFIRIPLVQPDRALDKLLPLLSFVYTRAFLYVTVASGIIGLYLTLRQWDSFLATMPWFFSFEGAALAGASLLASKMLHELGHALTAKRLGCRVPSMGVAFLVMLPVLYTDTSGAWRLPKRHQRLAIGMAGMAAECCLAAYALLAWSLLPDGVLRSIVFVWATTTWVLTLLINLSPFMRFDGYYLFSDFLDVPNLQDRAFALTRHKLREILFDLREPPPEHWSPEMRRTLITYAIATWAYRFVLFLGIALVVYHLFFKLLGIFLFAVEIWWFVLRPVTREIGEWIKRNRGKKMNARTILTLSLTGLFLIALLIPWQTSVHAPALLSAQSRVRQYAEVPGRVTRVLVKVGDKVAAGDPLVELGSPDIDYRLAQSSRAVNSLAAQLQAASQKAASGDREASPEAQRLSNDLDRARAEFRAAQAEHERLVVRSGISGTVVEMTEPLGTGEWLKVNELVATVANLDTTTIEAYVYEADFDRIRSQAEAVFIPADIAAPRVRASIIAVDDTSTRNLMDPELASINGGPIAIRETGIPGREETLVPELPVYRILLAPNEPLATRGSRTGTAILEAVAASPAKQLWRRIASILIRESGF
ncbi:efflux RND transporter periplasmic adaptor subunit [Pseudochelatococcus contaminans]|uniref:Putative peptide zinc metalloprotease protein n=1 Tax=Pseudochelatococcus contaminans TaxID=1538103 RepID=A0A7W5Z1K4_9HYPH|nr:HlyD family efflux transporter periplasmic adaptor subunit [Pseudochelatococcus contaminans]MBB3808172.1 putative peptide zinc metalloprotease protein [Pseudochelatococcus contaminans]